MSVSTSGFKPSTMRRRVAIFASYSPNKLLPPQVLPYLEGLKPWVSEIIVVCDNDLHPEEQARLSGLATHVITGRHGEYDFGSYKRGFIYARDTGLLETADDLILCNDSCFGPVGSFAPMFETMEARGLDVWGATDSHQFSYHLQSYWVVLGRRAFTAPEFNSFLLGIERQPSVSEVVMKYELGMSKVFASAGMTMGAMVENDFQQPHAKDFTWANFSIRPLCTLERGMPLVKVKAFKHARTNLDGQNRLLRYLKERAPIIYEAAISNPAFRRFEDADTVGFSLIMPTYNRAAKIIPAITSVFSQTHEYFELIVVDDGSTDDTAATLKEHFQVELAKGRLRYIQLDQNVGVCSARNIGISYAKHPWIGYVDSDNKVRPYFLTMMANAIIEHPEKEAFYGQIIHSDTGAVVGKSFDRVQLERGNYIDLGAFVHRKSLIGRHGGFDAELRRLVDWDLILTLTRDKPPQFLPVIFVDYDNDTDPNRITVRESYVSARVSIFRKNAFQRTVTTAILSYNHQEFLVQAIESALAQKGDFAHEILLSDDGSTDGTRRIIAHYAQKHPHRIRDISPATNLGVSGNYRHCFTAASGEFIAILEGDDYWTDPDKNAKQAEFLAVNPDVGFVFSRVEVVDETKGKRRLLKRQEGLKPLLSGQDFVDDENLNPIANLSSTMHRRDIVQRALPSALYDPRLSEMGLGLAIDSLGLKIGFINSVMGVYRLNQGSVWTGASAESRLRQAIATREAAIRMARPELKAAVTAHRDRKQRELETHLKHASS